jgi:hypothetical protein
VMMERPGLITLVVGLLVIGILWAAGVHAWPARIDLPATMTHGDEVLDFGLREMK